jgi:hypothetical protein
MMKQLYRRASACCLAILLTACSSSSNNDPDRDPSVPPPPEGVKVQVIQDNKQVHVLTPTVDFSSGVMTITGFARRKPGVREVITGRIDIDVVDAEGADIDWIPAALVPASTPAEGKAEAGYIIRYGSIPAEGEAGYTIHYGWIPPAGSVIKIRFVDSKTASLEDSADGDTVGGTYGTHTGGGGGGGHGGHHGGMGHM